MPVEAVLKPARMSIVKLSTGEELEAQFNPTELEETIEVTWNRVKILGLSHTVLQYSNTENYKTTLNMHFEAEADGKNRGEYLNFARRFLFSLCYPSRASSAAGDIIGSAPSRVLFVWPGLASLTCVVTKVNYKHTQFNILSEPTRSDATVDIEEILDFRIFAEDVAAEGTFRSSGEI